MGRRLELAKNLPFLNWKLNCALLFFMDGHELAADELTVREIAEGSPDGTIIIETSEGRSPYLSLEDAYKLDDVRDALRRGDIESAARLGRIFKLTPVTISHFCYSENALIQVLTSSPISPDITPYLLSMYPWRYIIFSENK